MSLAILWRKLISFKISVFHCRLVLPVSCSFFFSFNQKQTLRFLSLSIQTQTEQSIVGKEQRPQTSHAVRLLWQNHQTHLKRVVVSGLQTNYAWNHTHADPKNVDGYQHEKRGFVIGNVSGSVSVSGKLHVNSLGECLPRRLYVLPITVFPPPCIGWLSSLPFSAAIPKRCKNIRAPHCNCASSLIVGYSLQLIKLKWLPAKLTIKVSFSSAIGSSCFKTK